MQNSLNVLKHLEYLTDNFQYNGKEIYYIQLYSKKVDGKYIPIVAKNEGIACVDDVARAVVLATEAYEFQKDSKMLDLAKKWLTFLEYMQDEEGYITNFLENKAGTKKEGVPSSYKGGAWWSARAKWAWARIYNITKDEKYLDLYFKTKISEEYTTDIASLLLIAGLEILEKENKDYLQNLIDKIYSEKSKEGYFIYGKDESLHLWGYHQLEAIAKTYKAFIKDEKLLVACKVTADTLVKDVIENDFYFEYFSKSKIEINPYCVSPLVRGLYELYSTDKNPEYLKLLQKCFDWFKKLYDAESGRCFDWVANGKVTSDCGAEASIEAGFSYLRKLNL